MPKAEHPIAGGFHLGGTVIVGLRRQSMLSAIQLDRELSRGTGEVSDMTANRMLPSGLPRQAARSDAASIYPNSRARGHRAASDPAGATPRRDRGCAADGMIG
jgi:hypothetical protein